MFYKYFLPFFVLFILFLNGIIYSTVFNFDEV